MICNNQMNSDGTGSKRKALEMITNIFCKKSKECENLSAISEPMITNSGEYSNLCSNRTPCLHSLSVPEGDNNCCYSDVLPKSPISPRVKNIHHDMEALMLSRQDNPYIMQQLERLSTKDSELSMSAHSLHSSPARSVQRASTLNFEHKITSDGNFIMDDNISDSREDNLHDKLIRSPPPQFPKNLSLFVFPVSSAGSVQSYRTGDNGEYSPSRFFLSPSFNQTRDGNCSEMKNRSNDKISVSLKSNDLRYSRANQYSESSPNNYLKYERRGSDSSIISNNWKPSLFNQSMTASSSSLLSFVPRHALHSRTPAPNDSNKSYNECQTTTETDRKSGTPVDLMDIYSNFDDNSDNQLNFMSPSNSREALLNDISQVT